jgi:hypothetical protein
VTATRLPSAKAVRDLLSALIGRDVTVAPGEPVAAATVSGGAAAVYVNDQLRLVAAAALDLALTAYLGGSLGLLPPARVRELLDEGSVSNSALENVVEVLNVVGVLLNVTGAPHVKLYSVVFPGDLPPADISELLNSLGGRLDLNVAVPGYGLGALSLVLA